MNRSSVVEEHKTHTYVIDVTSNVRNVEKNTVEITIRNNMMEVSTTVMPTGSGLQRLCFVSSQPCAPPMFF